MRTSALVTAALSVCLVPVYGRHAPPVFFVSGERFSFESRGGGPALRFGRGEVMAGDISMRFGDGQAEPEPADPLPFHVNIIAGNNPARWRTQISAYGRIRYRAVYPGIDLVYHSGRDRLEFDFIVEPGADYRRIQLRFGPASTVRVGANGDLLVKSHSGELRHRPPVVYQESHGVRRAVTGQFVRGGPRTVAFAVGRYDRTLPLVIDPVVSYSSFIGGTASDSASAIATGANGSVYLAATTTCPSCVGANTDILVIQMDAAGTSLVYATYLGGRDADSVTDLALDSAGNVYLTGSTKSGDFPFTAGAYRRATGATEVFVAKLNSSGTVAYSTTIGTGTGYGIAVSAAGNVYVAGSTAGEFPLTAGAWQSTPQGMSDAFVTQLAASGSALVYSTVVGGAGDDHARAIALDGSGQVTIAGHTSKPAAVPFPVTAGAYTGGAASGIDAFVVRLNAAGTALAYSSVIGGSNDDFAYAVAVDSQTNAYITGVTASGNFPTTPGALRTASSAGFVTKLNATGTGLVYSTYLGADAGTVLCADQPAGRLCGGGLGIAVDAAGRAHVTGSFSSSGISTADAPQYSHAGGTDAFAAQLDAAGASLLFGTLLGGSASDVGQDIALDAAGEIYISGTTTSSDWPVRDGYDGSYNGAADALVAAIRLSSAACSYTLPVASHSVGSAGGTGSFAVSAQSGCPWMSAVTTAYNNPFVTITSSPLGSGAGTISYSVAANAAAISRTSTIAVARKIYTITQAAAPCTYSLSMDSASVGSSGGNGNVIMTVPLGCVWGASSSAAWVTVSISGSTVSYSVASNSGPARSATITAGGQTFTITQASLACTYSLSSALASVASEGGSGSFAVTASGHCGWTTSSSAAWVTASASGSTVSYSVASNSGPARSATVSVAGQTFTITQAAGICGYNLPAKSVSVARAGGTGSFTIEASEGCSWAVSGAPSWITVTSGLSGTATATVHFKVLANSGAPRAAVLAIAGQKFTVAQTGTDSTPPFGSLDIPLDNTTGVVGAIGVSGWALDNGEVTKITVWREPLRGEPVHPNGLVYIGDAVFVEDARPDVAKLYTAFPFSHRAGWGMQILTNMLPNSNADGGNGNGTYRIHVIAEDAAGNRKTLGARSITCTNATATKPFGTLDTPGHGSTISGFIPNWGWALTPSPYKIPEDASTIWVFIDGESVGHPIYNLNRADISSLFPGRQNSGGAVGVYYFATAELSNGLHSIAWSVTDNGGRIEGIGSRLFMVSNISTSVVSAGSGAKAARKSAGSDGVYLRTGYDPLAPLRVLSFGDGQYDAEVPAMSRMELHLPLNGRKLRGCLVRGDDCVQLPAGSKLSPDGVFYWQIDPAFRGSFNIRFTSAGDSVLVAVTVAPA